MSGWFKKNLQSLVIVSQILAILLLIFLFGIRGLEYSDLESQLQKANESNNENIIANNSSSASSSKISAISSFSSTISTANNSISQNSVSISTSTVSSSITSTNSQISESPKKFVPIVMYHHIEPNFVNSKDPILADLTMHPDQFEKNLKDIVNKKYTTIFPQEIFTELNSNPISIDKSIVLSFDDGYEDFYKYAFPLLKKYNMKSIVYLIVDKMGKHEGNNDYLTWDQVKELQASGLVAIGSHTMTHPNLAGMTEKAQRYEIFESKKEIEEKLGITILDFCYPLGKYNATSVKLVEEAGYNNATTVTYGFDRKLSTRFEWPRLRTHQTTSLASYI